MIWYILLTIAGILLVAAGIGAYNDYRDMADYLGGKNHKKEK